VGMSDPYIAALLERIDHLTYLLRRQQKRTSSARISRDMWRTRARASERAFRTTLYSRRRIRFLEDQLLKLNGERREANRFEADQARRSEREAAAA
jgi:hypothetical protein